jgi:hypothetical protein
MNDIRMAFKHLITGAKTYKLLLLMGISVISTISPPMVAAQAPDPAASIRELKDGYLIVRFPAYRAKIDTLAVMVQKTTDPDKKARLLKQTQETMAKRDTLQKEYIEAFKNQYQFSKVAYFLDYEGHDLQTASYRNLQGEPIPINELSEVPLYYLYFERTDQSKIDALVVYNANGNRLLSPFPNNFSRGGINFLFIGIADKNFPAWRIGRINKQFFKFWSESQLR